MRFCRKCGDDRNAWIEFRDGTFECAECYNRIQTRLMEVQSVAEGKAKAKRSAVANKKKEKR